MDDNLPADLESIADLLREQRAAPTPLELDSLKLRVRSQAASGRTHTTLPKGLPMRPRLVTAAVALLLIGGTAAGGIAAGNGSGDGSAAVSQYRPGNGCGDKNHTHTGPPGQGTGPQCPPDSPNGGGNGNGDGSPGNSGNAPGHNK